jgi:protein required for attachment to host cells
MTTWILVADACGARVFQTTDSGRTLNFFKRFAHAESRAMEAQLASDRQGSARSSDHLGASTMHPHTARKEIEAINFARLLADHLRASSQRQQFASLVLVAPPHFLGLLREALSPATSRLVLASLAKELVYMNAESIREHLAAAVWPVRSATPQIN